MVRREVHLKCNNLNKVRIYFSILKEPPPPPKVQEVVKEVVKPGPMKLPEIPKRVFPAKKPE